MLGLQTWCNFKIFVGADQSFQRAEKVESDPNPIFQARTGISQSEPDLYPKSKTSLIFIYLDAYLSSYHEKAIKALYKLA